MQTVLVLGEGGEIRGEAGSIFERSIYYWANNSSRGMGEEERGARGWGGRYGVHCKKLNNEIL